jgi:hypothetical protein
MEVQTAAGRQRRREQTPIRETTGYPTVASEAVTCNCINGAGGRKDFRRVNEPGDRLYFFIRIPLRT